MRQSDETHRGKREGKQIMKKYYVIRRGWNAANQSSFGSNRNPKSTFESNLDKLVDIVEAESEYEAIKKTLAICYNNQFLRATSNPRSVKGLLREINNAD